MNVKTQEQDSPRPVWLGGGLGPKISWDDIDRLEGAHPDLGSYGFFLPGARERGVRGAPREDLISAGRSEAILLELNQCADILRAMTRIKPTAKSGVGSYGLKHVFEDLPWVSSYISNGLPIAAALLIGVSIKHLGGPNAMIGVPAREVSFFSPPFGGSRRSGKTPPRWADLADSVRAAGIEVCDERPWLRNSSA